MASAGSRMVFDSGTVAAWDSSGIRVVRNAPPRLLEVPDWSDRVREITRLGGYDAPPEEIFSGVTDVQILGDSAIAVANGHSFTVAVFGLDGAPLRTVGRRGGGPGEYQDISSISVCEGGTLAVVDLLQRRMTLLAPDLEDEHLVPIEDANDESSPYAAECTSDGRVLILGRWNGWPVDMPLGPHHVPVFLTLLDPSDGSARAFGQVGGMDRYRQETQDGPRYFGGKSALAESRGNIYVTDPTAAMVRRYDMAGRLAGIIHTAQPREAVSSAHVEALTERIVTRLRRLGADDGRIASNRRWFRDYEYPDSFPAISSVLADDSGRVWIEDYRATREAPRTWRILSAHGVLRATITLPPGFELKDVRAGLLAGVSRDSLDAPVVEVLSLRR